MGLERNFIWSFETLNTNEDEERMDINNKGRKLKALVSNSAEVAYGFSQNLRERWFNKYCEATESTFPYAELNNKNQQ